MPLDVTPFKSATDIAITNKTDPSSITPPNVGGQINNLADLISDYINSYLSTTESKTYTEEDFDGEGYIHLDRFPPSSINRNVLAAYVNGEPVAGVLYYKSNPNDLKLGGFGSWFNPEDQQDLSINVIFI